MFQLERTAIFISNGAPRNYLMQLAFVFCVGLFFCWVDTPQYVILPHSILLDPHGNLQTAAIRESCCYSIKCFHLHSLAWELVLEELTHVII